jgi:hypothetical protein
LYDGPRAQNAAATADFKRVFGVVAKAQGPGDAALAAFAKATKYEAVTLESRLYNFLTQTRKDLGVPIRRVK